MGAATGRPPKILQVVLSLNPGGTERLVVELVKRLRAELPMAVCCLDEDGSWGERLRREDVGVTALTRRDGFQPQLGRAIARIAARASGQRRALPSLLAVRLRVHRAAVVAGLRIVFTEHGRLSDAPPSAKRRVANRVLSHAPREVVTVSADLKQHLVAEGFPAGKVDVIYNGIDVGAAPRRRACARASGASSAIADDDVVVGTVARLDPVKDLHDADSRDRAAARRGARR